MYRPLRIFLSSIFELLSPNRLLLLMKNVILEKEIDKIGSFLESTYHSLRNRFNSLLFNFRIAFG